MNIAAPALTCHSVSELSLASSADLKVWDTIVEQSPLADVYYRSPYVLASAAIYQGAPIGLRITCGNEEFLVPLIIRDLPACLAAGHAWQDAITPYGYGGILPLRQTSVSPEAADSVVAALRQWAERHAIVSILLRLHPLLRQHLYWSARPPEEGVRLHLHSRTTAIEVQHWNEGRDCPASLKWQRRGKAVTLAKRMLTYQWSSDVDAFRRVYECTMSRLNAAALYHFPENYYYGLLRAGSPDPIVLARLDGEVVGSAWFLFGTPLSHIHLSGSTEAGTQCGAPTLLINAGAKRARALGATLFHLGGGLRDGDSLFEFKASFGGPTFEYSFLTVECMPDAYSELVRRRAAVHPPISPDSTFFPRYRTGV